MTDRDDGLTATLGVGASTMGVWGTLARLFAYVRAYRTQAWIIFASLVVDVLLGIFFSLSVKLFIDYAITPGDRHALMALVLALILSFVVVATAQLGRDYLYAWLGARVLADLRRDMFLKVQRLSVGFFSETKLGDLLARFSSDLAAVENAILLSIPQALFAVLNVVFGIVVMIVLEWRLAVLILLGTPLCLFAPHLFGRKALTAGDELRARQATLLDMIQENLAAQKIVKALDLHGATSRVFDRQLSSMARLASRFFFLSSLTERSPNIVMLGFGVLVIAGGAVMAFRGDLSVGSWVSFNLLYVSVSAYVESLSAAAPNLLLATSGMRRISTILDARPSVTEPVDALPLTRDGSGIKFRHVTFGYRPGERNITDITLDIPRGSKVAFVGPSGGGKSTCLNLMLRFHDPDAGEISIDDRNLRGIMFSSLYAQVGVVFQDNFLFNDTVRENIRLGRPDATNEDVENAAHNAELETVIHAMPMQFDTMVGGHGARLSGGERQRIAIARALIGSRPIIVLDEATSALDPSTAAAILETLRRATKDRTVITITHRLQETISCDRIFVFDRGRLVEAGTHEALLREAGIYANLWRRQSALSLSADGSTGRITLDALAEIPLFRPLDRLRLEELGQQFTTEHAPAERAVIEQGDEGSKFFIIVRGKVAVTVEDEAGIRHNVAALSDGDYFGEMSLMARASTNATVTTIVPCIFLTLQREQFNRLIRGDATLSRELDKTFRERRDANARAIAPTRE